jgi:vesicle coat complex subunit
MKAQSSIYIVTQCLVKDIQDKNDYFKINSLRTIHLVLDSSNLPQVERYIKTLIVNNNFGVACAGLLCGIQLFYGHE